MFSTRFLSIFYLGFWLSVLGGCLSLSQRGQYRLEIYGVAVDVRVANVTAGDLLTDRIAQEIERFDPTVIAALGTSRRQLNLLQQKYAKTHIVFSAQQLRAVPVLLIPRGGPEIIEFGDLMTDGFFSESVGVFAKLRLREGSGYREFMVAAAFDGDRNADQIAKEVAEAAHGSAPIFLVGRLDVEKFKAAGWQDSGNMLFRGTAIQFNPPAVDTYRPEFNSFRIEDAF